MRILAAGLTQPYAQPMTRSATKRLTKSDWLAAGFDAMVNAGPAALKAEPLARQLGTTKGSFYWHFSDVPEFHAELLGVWETLATDNLLAAIAIEATPVARLRRLGQMIADPPDTQAADPSIRAWARGNELAARAVARVDVKRLAYLQGLLSKLDIENPEMARIIYAASVGIAHLPASGGQKNADAIGSLVDLVLALR